MTDTYTPVQPGALKPGDSIRVKAHRGTVWIPGVVHHSATESYIAVRLDGNSDANSLAVPSWRFERARKPLPTAPGIYMSAARSDPNVHPIYRLRAPQEWYSDERPGNWHRVHDLSALPDDLVRFMPETSAA